MKDNKYDCQICNLSLPDSELARVMDKNICLNCLKLMWEIENNRLKKIECTKSVDYKDKMIFPTVLKDKLDKYIIGQEHAKKVFSVAIYNHYKRLALNNSNIAKSNILMIGPTGSGKTHMIKTLAKILDVPIAITVATTLTEEGYIGESVDSVIEKLYFSAGKDINRTEAGIVFIDEIDKLTQSSDYHKRSVGATGVQQALLAMLEGTKVTIGNKYGMFRDVIEIDTSKILFVCGGAFPRLETIIKNRMNLSSTHIYNNSPKNKDESILFHVTNEDLVEYGLIPEFIGRLPVIAPYENMSVEILRGILEDPVDSIISEYQQLFEYNQVKLTFQNDALDAIAKKAHKIGTGARSLRSILENLLLDTMFSTPANSSYISEIKITSNFVDGISEPNYVLKR